MLSAGGGRSLIRLPVVLLCVCLPACVCVRMITHVITCWVVILQLQLQTTCFCLLSVLKIENELENFLLLAPQETFLR